jgi:hypothetical protein
MEINALEQLISEDVKVQGQISCVMVSELASWSSESSSELLSESPTEEMRSTNTTLLPRLSLEEYALTSMRVDCFFLRIKETNPASPWRALLESANLALARVYGFLPRANEEPTSSMECRGRRTGWRRLLFVTAEPHSLGGGSGQQRGRRTGTWPRGLLLTEPRPTVTGHTCFGDEAETRRRKPEKGIEGGRQGGVFIKKVRMRK